MIDNKTGEIVPTPSPRRRARLESLVKTYLANAHGDSIAALRQAVSDRLSPKTRGTWSRVDMIRATDAMAEAQKIHKLESDFRGNWVCKCGIELTWTKLDKKRIRDHVNTAVLDAALEAVRTRRVLV